MLHTIRVDIADRGAWNASGAVSVENSKTPTVEAVKALAASGIAKPSDTVRVNWQGAPFIARGNRVLDYKPSLPPSRRSERRGAASSFR